MIRDFLNKGYGSSELSTNFRDQRGIPSPFEEKLWALRGARLRRIVKYATGTVPYCQNLFREEGIDPQGLKPVRDLRHTRLVDKYAARRVKRNARVA